MFSLLSAEDAALVIDFVNRFSSLVVAEQEAAERLAAFDNLPLCCGHSYFNDKKAMYIHHSAVDNCPLHGVGKDGRGARAYIGKKSSKQYAAMDAMQDYESMVKARSGLLASRRSVVDARHNLSRLAVVYTPRSLL